jgi:enoyl-CoA hydratase
LDTTVDTTAGLITSDVTGGVAVLRLNDPGRRNALSLELSRALALAVRAAVSGGAGVIVLTAAPPVFSAGGDIDVLTRTPVPLDELYEGFLALGDAPVPTLAVVDGLAVGAGVNFALACDVVLATPRAVFDPRFIDVGMHPGGGHLWRLERRVGRQAAAAMVLFGEALTGEEAVSRGFAWKCLPSDQVHEAAMALAARAAARDRALVLRTKATMRAGDSMKSAAEAVVVEREAQKWALSRPEFRDRIAGIRRRVGQRGTR